MRPPFPHSLFNLILFQLKKEKRRPRRAGQPGGARRPSPEKFFVHERMRIMENSPAITVTFIFSFLFTNPIMMIMHDDNEIMATRPHPIFYSSQRRFLQRKPPFRGIIIGHRGLRDLIVPNPRSVKAGDSDHSLPRGVPSPQNRECDLIPLNHRRGNCTR